MRPVGTWSVSAIGNVISTSPKDSGFPNEIHERGHLVAESIGREMLPTIAALPDLINALEMVRDADEDCREDRLPRVLPPHARAVIDAALEKAGVK